MIVYNVQCSKGHVFEEWFDSSQAFDAQSAAGEIACPDCGDTKVTRAIMAPRVAKAAAAPAPSCGAGGGCASAGMCPMAQGR